MAVDPENGFVLVYSPCPDLATAEALGETLVAERLAACVNILPRMISIYPWEGRTERAEEAVLIAKTAQPLAAALRDFLEREHPYDVPAILVLPLAEVNRSYADWLLASIGTQHAPSTIS